MYCRIYNANNYYYKYKYVMILAQCGRSNSNLSEQGYMCTILKIDLVYHLNLDHDQLCKVQECIQTLCKPTLYQL